MAEIKRTLLNRTAFLTLVAGLCLFFSAFFVTKTFAHSWSPCICPFCLAHSGACSGGFDGMGPYTGASCLSCPGGQCPQAENFIIQDHEQGETAILNNMRQDFHQHREWIVNEYLPDLILPALMLMTEQMSSVAMYQMYLVGKIFDSKLHLETQRLFNELQNEAAKDYYPSDSFCWFGTNARSLSNSEALAQSNQGTLNRISFVRQLGEMNSSASYTSVEQDKRGRWEQFTTDYCDPFDNDHDLTGVSGLSHAGVCGTTGATNPYRANIDIDFQRLIEEPRFLDIDFTDPALTDDEEDVIALSSNLYGHEPVVIALGSGLKDSVQHNYYNLRSVAAKRSVATNSYNAIVGLKSRGSGGGSSAQYLKAIMADLGMANADVEEILGENPSYYAQLEALGKKIYQNTDFFTDLYDKPANVKRKQAAMNAIELMLDRAIYESELRQEVVLSVLLTSYLEVEKEGIYLELQNLGKE